MRATRLVSLFLGLMIVLTSACQKLSNSFSEVKLECGADAESSLSYVQVLNPRGETLSAEQIIIRAVKGQGSAEELRATSRGCFPVQDQNSFYVVTSSRDEIPWGAIIDLAKLPHSRQIRLGDISQAKLKVQCPSAKYINAGLMNPVIADGNDPAFPYQLRVLQDGARIDLDPTLNLAGPLPLPGALNDGPFLLEVAYQNLFKAQDAALTQPALQCPYTLDREAPAPVDSLSETLSPDLYKVLPGAEVSLDLKDDNAESLHYCIEKENSSCADETNYLAAGAKLSFQAPASGHWCLYYYGLDKAGNRSPLAKRCAISYQAAVIESIRAFADNALIRVNDNRLVAATLMLRAMARYLELPTAEEKAALTDKLLGNLLTVGSAMKERTQVIHRTNAKMAAFLDLHLALDSQGLVFRDPVTLETKQTLALPGASEFVIRDHTLVVKYPAGLKIFENDQGMIRETETLLWPEGFNSQGTYSLHPHLDEILFVDSFGMISVFRREASHYTLVQTLEEFAGTKFVWSSLGDRLLIQDRNQTYVLNRSPEGLYSRAAFLENGFGIGAAYLAQDDSFLTLTEEGFFRFHSGSEFEVLTLKSVSNALAQVKDADFRDRLLAVGEDEVFVVLGSQFFSLKVNEGVLDAQLLRNLSSIDFKTMKRWSLDDGRLSVFLARDYYVLEKRVAENHWHIVQKVPGGTIDRYQATTFPTLHRSVTMERDSRVVSWAENTAYGSFQAENMDTASVQWLQDGERSLLATGGYTSAGRLWTREGVMETAFVHNPTASTQVRLNWNRKQDLFTTAGEDGRAVIYDRKGTQLFVLDDIAACATKEVNLRYVSLFADDDSTLITSGKSLLNVWTKSGDAYSPLSTCAQLGNQPLDFTRTEVGDVKTFRWNDRELIFAAPSIETRYLNIFEKDGSPSPAWKAGRVRMSAAALDNAGHVLALSPPGGGLEFYELTDEGFESRLTIPKEALPSVPERMAFSPDDKSLAVFFLQNTVKIFENKDGEWAESATRPLALDGFQKYFMPFWFDQSFAYFDKGVLNITDRSLNLRTKVSAFGENTSLTAADYNALNQTVAVQKEGEIKLLPLDLKTAHKELCEALRTYLKTPSSFIDPEDLFESDRAVCDGI